MLDISKLAVSFQTGFWQQRALQILKDFSLHIPKGEIYGLLGPNGAGKTTLLQAILGLVPYQQGTVLFDQKELSQEVLSNIGYSPDNTPFYEYMTGGENLQFFGQLHGLSPATINKVGDVFLKRLQLDFAKQRLVKTYSAGMKKRLGLIISLIHNPSFIIRDEPMSGVDPLGRILIKDLIKTLHHKEKTILFSTHILSDVEEIGDRCGILFGGKIIFDSHLDKLEDALEDIFREKVLSQTTKVM